MALKNTGGTKDWFNLNKNHAQKQNVSILHTVIFRVNFFLSSRNMQYIGNRKTYSFLYLYVLEGSIYLTAIY